MSKKNYYITKNNKKRELVSFEIELDGYYVKPKTKKKNSIEVSKIVFVNDEFSEKIIKKKIEKKIAYLLKQLKLILEDDSGDNEGIIRKTLMETEKYRLHIINEYKKYLGNTYSSLTLKKISIIIEQLKYKLFCLEEEKQLYYQNKNKESHRGR